VFDIGDSDQPRSCVTWRGAFAAASSPPGLALRRHGRLHRGVPKPDLRTMPARFGSLALGLVVWPVYRPGGGYDGEVIRDGIDFGGGEA
jgi:hypothetical protein